MKNLESPPSFVPGATFEEYSAAFAEHCIMERRENGAILLRFHSEGREMVWSPQVHRAIGQAVRAAGSDPENELIIISGTGDFFLAHIAGADEIGQVASEESEADRAQMSSRLFMGDGMDMIRALVYDTQVPTIGVINGPGFHTEIPLFCDLTITSDRMVMFDVHRYIGQVPGDGINIAYESTMGNKRANYAMLTTQAIDAQTALEYGMVNEVVPHDNVLDRAWELADLILRGGAARGVERRMTTGIMRKHWLTKLSQDFFGGFAAESFSYLVTPDASHDAGRIAEMFAQAGVTVPPRY